MVKKDGFFSYIYIYERFVCFIIKCEILYENNNILRNLKIILLGYNKHFYLNLSNPIQIKVVQTCVNSFRM